jgi:hypothetical protein
MDMDCQKKSEVCHQKINKLTIQLTSNLLPEDEIERESDETQQQHPHHDLHGSTQG